MPDNGFFKKTLQTKDYIIFFVVNLTMNTKNDISFAHNVAQGA